MINVKCGWRGLYNNEEWVPSKIVWLFYLISKRWWVVKLSCRINWEMGLVVHIHKHTLLKVITLAYLYGSSWELNIFTSFTTLSVFLSVPLLKIPSSLSYQHIFYTAILILTHVHTYSLLSCILHLPLLPISTQLYFIFHAHLHCTSNSACALHFFPVSSSPLHSRPIFHYHVG